MNKNLFPLTKKQRIINDVDKKNNDDDILTNDFIIEDSEDQDDVLFLKKHISDINKNKEKNNDKKNNDKDLNIDKNKDKKDDIKNKYINIDDDEDSLINDFIDDDKDDDVKLIIDGKEIEIKKENNKFIKDLDLILNNFIKSYNYKLNLLDEENKKLKSKLNQIQHIINY